MLTKVFVYFVEETSAKSKKKETSEDDTVSDMVKYNIDFTEVTNMLALS